MSLVLQRPYQFVPPHRGNLWPSFIQTFRLIDWHLRRREGVCRYECRRLEVFDRIVRRGDGVVLAPNHCRYADPVVLGWPAREIGTHLYAMASWHLFNTTRFEHFALRRMGAFSIHRESNDKQSLDTSVQILTDAERPLVLFPEGTTNRLNDQLMPLLDGVAFIARTAAKRRQKNHRGRVSILPVGLKYLCLDDIHDWADAQLAELEGRLGWHRAPAPPLIDRVMRLAEGMLALKEIEYKGRSGSGPLPRRRDSLMHHLLRSAEADLELTVTDSREIRDRVRRIRGTVVSRYFALPGGERAGREAEFRAIADKADFAQALLCYPDCYLAGGGVTDTKVLETIQRTQESIYGQAVESMPLKVIIEFGEPIDVPPQRAPRDQRDPVMVQLDDQLRGMIGRLAGEARRVG